MGCTASKTDDLNGEAMASHYTYHKPPPIHRRESNKNLGRNKTKTAAAVSNSSSSPRTPRMSGRVVHGQRDREIQGKRCNDGVGKLGFVEMKERYPSLGEAPSFKDYLVSSNTDGVDEVTKMNNGSDNEDFLAYASAGEASPMPVGEESANKDDAIVGEACLLPRDARERKSKVKGRRWVMTREKLKNMLHTSSWNKNHKQSIARSSS